MSRVLESKQNLMELQKRFSLNKEDTRQAFAIGILSDIADSLALLCDMYAIANNITMEKRKYGGEDSVGKA